MEKLTVVSTPDPRFVKILNNARLVLFILTAIIFLSIYLPKQIAVCNQTLNRTPDYVYNASCYCKNNVGSVPSLGQAMILNSTWATQFDYTASFFNAYLLVNTKDGSTFDIVSFGIPSYMNYYYGLEWTTNLVHEKTLSMFEIYDPLGFASSLKPNTLTGYCSVTFFNGSGGGFYHSDVPSVEECISYISPQYPEGFNPNITLGYSMNNFYREACDLDYCEIPYCSASGQTTIGFFVATVLGTMYTALRVVKFTILWFLYRKYRVPSSVTVPMVSSV